MDEGCELRRILEARVPQPAQHDRERFLVQILGELGVARAAPQQVTQTATKVTDQRLVGAAVARRNAPGPLGRVLLALRVVAQCIHSGSRPPCGGTLNCCFVSRTYASPQPK